MDISIINKFAAGGPYREDHNGVIGFANIRLNGDLVEVVDTNRVFDVTNYNVSASDDEIKFYREDSYFTLSPITADTPKEVFPDTVRTFPTADHAEELAVLALAAGGYAPTTAPAETVYFTLDDKDRVLELIRITEDGDMAYWEGGDWVDVEADGDYPTIYDRPMLEVEREDIGLAIEFWTKAQEESEAVKKADVTRFAALVQ